MVYCCPMSIYINLEMLAMQKNGCRAKEPFPCFINNHPINLQKIIQEDVNVLNGLKILSETQRHKLGKKYKLSVQK